MWLIKRAMNWCKYSLVKCLFFLKVLKNQCDHAKTRCSGVSETMKHFVYASKEGRIDKLEIGMSFSQWAF
jgi:hypothetical protein